MGQYCRVMIIDSNKRIEVFKDFDFPNLNQSYDSFAVLAGIRNYCNIKPIFGYRDSYDLFKDIETEYLVGYDWRARTHFTLAEFDAFDLDQPLAFIEPHVVSSASEAHRLDSLKEGDTYRSFIERETVILQWIESLRALNLPDITVVMFFD